MFEKTRRVLRKLFTDWRPREFPGVAMILTILLVGQGFSWTIDVIVHGITREWGAALLALLAFALAKVCHAFTPLKQDTSHANTDKPAPAGLPEPVPESEGRAKP